MTQILFAPSDAVGIRPGDLGVVEKAFARHETFHPRFGWLKKGFDAALRQPDVFFRDDAPVILGVGKNMVRAIRYWCVAFKVLEEYPNSEHPRLRNVRPTVLGDALLNDDGYDPYLEHPGSLWLLHWLLLRPVSSAPAWYYTFNLVRSVEFTDRELTEELRTFRDAHPGWSRVMDKTLKRDVDCLLRMYAAGSARSRISEDGLDSPFLDLRLMAPTAGDRRHVRFNVGPKDNLPDGIVTFAALDYLATAGHAAATITLRRLTHDEASPGRAFKLTEQAISDSLARHGTVHGGVQITDPAGIGQLAVTGDLRQVAATALAATFRSGGGR